jgi:hypothetical protein
MKPTVVAADAGLMGIQWGIRPVRKYVESVRQSGTDDMRRASVVEVARLMTMDDDEQREEEIYRARRQRSAASAATPKTFVMCIVVSCGIRDRKRWRTELYFGGSESFDDHHWATALRAAPKIVWTIGDRRVLLVVRPRSRRKQLKAARQRSSAAAIGQKAEVSDAHETLWEQMQQEAAQKLIDRKSHPPLLVVVSGVAPVESDLAIRKGNQAMVGDGYAMRVAAQILEHMVWTPEGSFGIDHPVFSEQRP